ncbi:MAG: DUF262 domain-containing protein [Chloroflexi bacterium]|nr:DUF262 domain-containing protein [Chloroflexota bacterium]
MNSTVAESDEVEIEDNITEEPDESIPFKYSITSYGADFTVDGLVKRLNEGSIFIPQFQRAYVWTQRQASRFIESLLLGLPVPGIFLSREHDSQKLLVIDGQQRLRTLQAFCEGHFPRRDVSSKEDRIFALDLGSNLGYMSRFDGTTYKGLSLEDKRRFDDSILHATIVKQDEPTDDNSSVYFIFERLNTGGTPLRPQEIRACIYHGEFNELLQHLNRTAAWRSITGSVSRSMRDQELILRFFALYFQATAYEKPMKDFLNKYMSRNRHCGVQDPKTMTHVFTLTIETIFACVGKQSFKPKRALNAAVFDAVMVGMARRLEKGGISDCEDLRSRYETLTKNAAFINATETGTSSEESVATRVSMATAAFENVQ